jgi:signal transduction histidine kinase/CheY-like chemotaxis protein/CHASE3 domain sensor protein
MKSTFKSNLLTGFGLSLFLLVVSSVASYYSIVNLISSSDMVDHTNQVIFKSEEIVSNLKDAETGQRGFLLTKDQEFLTPFHGSEDRTRSAFEELQALTRDNLEQQKNCDSLEVLINKRFGILNGSLQYAIAGKSIDTALLKVGQGYMQKIRFLVKEIQSIEQFLLMSRTKELKRFTTYTPIVIVVAAILAILITIYFFKRVSDEFRAKAELTEQLEKKEKEIASRLRIIQSIAAQIAEGDYKIRLNTEESDELGTLAVSLNRMADSLHGSFTLLGENEWLQTGTSKLAETMAGEKAMLAISADIVHFVAEYIHCETGALYLANNGHTLELTATYALPKDALKQHIESGEGIAGQAYKGKTMVRLNNIEEKLFTSFAGGQIKPNDIVAFPIYFEGTIIGVLELATIHSFKDIDIKYLENISGITGVSLNTARNRARLKELLEETQSQSEELQVQHRELENMNVELEAQAEKLQSSEEELKVQQEELMETNQALEERSRMLEERNHLVAMRNLEIQKKAEELAQSTKYKSEFLANMSHELRTPLNSILLLSRLLAENNQKNLSSDQVEYAQVIQTSGNGLLQLIDEILDLSKIESGKLELSYEMIPISDIISSMKMLFVPLTRDKNIDFNVFVADDVPAQIETDKFRLEQILKNLLSNALKFTAKGSMELKLTMSRKHTGYIDFSVKDTGIGIPDDKQDAIFEAFQQADGSTKRNYGGTGLGLSISRQLAKLLSGDISLKSKVSEGSEFTLYIPASKNATIDTNEETTIEAPEKKVSQEPIAAFVTNNKLVAPDIPQEIPDDRDNPGPPEKLLMIVEDDTAFAKALLEFVRQRGYKGIVVVRGDKAIEVARHYRPSGILLDIQLPVKDGLQVMDELKSHPVTRHIPVHMMSSFEFKRESLGRGAVDFINKPMIPAQMGSILEKIEAALKRDTSKVLIVEDNTQHAKALAYFLSNHGIKAEMSADINESTHALLKKEVNCVIMDMGVPATKSYEALDALKKNDKLSNIPIIIFTGKSLSRSEEQRIRQYADSIVIKTAHSYQRILDEVSLFLHLMDENYGQKSENLRKKATLDSVLKNKTVLITDDDVRNVFALSKALEKHQMQVITTMDGKEALKALNDNPSIDMVLMDMMMPGMDGYETITRIRQDARWKRLPVLAVTAKAMTGDREKCIQAGASDYITKPVDSDQLISLMRIWLQETMK